MKVLKSIHASYIYYTIFGLSIIWILIGVFPLVNIESDSALTIAGCERLFQKGFLLPPDYIYGWDMQPLVATFVLAVKGIVPSLNCQTIFTFLSALSGLVLLFISAFWLSKRLNILWVKMALLLLLIPETYSIMYYPNTAVFASLFFWGGILCLEKKKINLWAIILLGLAPLFRVDILIMYPFILLNFIIQKVSIKETIKYTITYAVSTLLIIIVGFYLLKANPLMTFSHYTDLREMKHHVLKDFLEFHIAFYTPIFAILLVLGTIEFFKENKGIEYLSLILPILFFYYIYFPFSGCAAKHLLYVLPLFAYTMYFGFKFIKHKKLLKITCFSVFILQSFIGLIYYPNNKPWVKQTYASLHPFPFHKNLNLINHSGGSLNLALSTGTIISTADEIMPVSGYFFTPFLWHHVKDNLKQEQNILSLLFEQSSDTTYFISTQASHWQLAEILHINDYVLKDPLSNPRIYEKGNKIIYNYETAPTRDIDSFNALGNVCKERPLYLFVDWDWQKYFVNENLTKFIPISKQLSYVK